MSSGGGANSHHAFDVRGAEGWFASKRLELSADVGGCTTTSCVQMTRR
jgi:hypothetical protein